MLYSVPSTIQVAWYYPIRFCSCITLEKKKSDGSGQKILSQVAIFLWGFLFPVFYTISGKINHRRFLITVQQILRRKIACAQQTCMILINKETVQRAV